MSHAAYESVALGQALANADSMYIVTILNKPQHIWVWQMAIWLAELHD